jgi:hypothetical protein
MKQQFKLLLTGAMLVASCAALADNLPSLLNGHEQDINSGAYIGLNAGYAKINETVSKTLVNGVNVGGTKNDNQGFTGSIDAGYQFLPTWAAEFGGYYLPKESFGNGIKGQSNYFVYAAIKGLLPVGSGFHLFAKLGPAYVHHKLTDANNDVTISGSGAKWQFALYGALGLGYNFNHHVSMNVQLAATSNSGHVPANFVGTLGLAYHF